MSRISRNISIVLRAERLIAQRQVTIAAKRAGFYAAAGLAAGLAVIMLNVAGYLALSASLSKPLSALIVAGCNLGLAALLAVVAGTMNAQSDTETATELRDMALNDIEAEFREGLSHAQDTVTGLRRMSQDPLGTLAPSLVAVIVNALVKYAKREKE